MILFRSAALVTAGLVLSFNAFGKCPISPRGTLELRAPAGNITVDTTGVDAVEVEVSNREVVLQENCGRDTVTVTATVPTVIGVPDWRVRVPRTVLLDVSTQGGSIQVGDSDGPEVRLRTSGGRVTTGNIKGSALIYANDVRTGDIGGNAELRGTGGKLQVGNVGGDALFSTTGGDILTGLVKGRVKADTGSGSVAIRESNGDVIVSTLEGDITSNYVRGGFDGKTDSGNIRLERVGSWVHAITKVGDIFFRLVPEKLTGDLHIRAESALGNITMYLPEKISATFDAVIDRPAFNAKRIFSEFPVNVTASAINGLKGLVPGSRTPEQRLIPGGPERYNAVLAGGTNSIKVRTSAGTISFRVDRGN
jgi:hypothetical protein